MTEVARLVDELTTLLYEVVKRWQLQDGRVCEIVQCGACRRNADNPELVVHESDCPVRRLWQALELGEVVVRANAEEICDLEDERDNALGKLAELTRTAEWVTARCESANARIAALEAENARLKLTTRSDREYAEMKARAEESERQVAVLREAQHVAIDCLDRALGAQRPYSLTRTREVRLALDGLRAALAAAGGEVDGAER